MKKYEQDINICLSNNNREISDLKNVLLISFSSICLFFRSFFGEKILFKKPLFW